MIGVIDVVYVQNFIGLNKNHKNKAFRLLNVNVRRTLKYVPTCMLFFIGL